MEGHRVSRKKLKNMIWYICKTSKTKNLWAARYLSHMMQVKWNWPQTLTLHHFLLEDSRRIHLQLVHRKQIVTQEFYTQKTIIHYSGNKPKFLNMQEFKAFCFHEPVLKKVSEEELCSILRNGWKTIAKA